MGSNPCKRLSLLGIAHLVARPPFSIQGVYRETALRRGRDCEEGRHVALTSKKNCN